MPVAAGAEISTTTREDCINIDHSPREQVSAIVGTAMPRHDNSLASNAMGTGSLVFTVLAALAPLTLIVAVAPLHFLKGGSSVPGGFILAGGVMALFAVGFMSMNRYTQNAGAFYSVIAKGLGKPLGAGASLVALLAYNALQISTYGAFGLYADEAMQRYVGVVLPWWCYAVAAVMCVGWLGFRGIDTSARVLGCILVAEILVLVVLAGSVIGAGVPNGFPVVSYLPANVLRTSNGAMYTLIFGAFMGFESTTIFSEEARGGQRTIRRATFIAVGFIAIFYSIMTAVVVAAYGADGITAAAERDTANLVVNLFIRYTPPLIVEAMHVLVLGSAFAALLALHNVANRYFYALGRDGLLPASLAMTHPRYRSPWHAGLLQSLLALAVIASTVLLRVDPYLGLLLWGSALGLIGIIFLWALCSLAIVLYLRRMEDQSLWSSTVAPSVAFVVLAGIFALALSNVAFLTGATPLVDRLLLGALSLAFGIGIARSLQMRCLRPGLYLKFAQGDRP